MMFTCTVFIHVHVLYMYYNKLTFLIGSSKNTCFELFLNFLFALANGIAKVYNVLIKVNLITIVFLHMCVLYRFMLETS